MTTFNNADNHRQIETSTSTLPTPLKKIPFFIRILINILDRDDKHIIRWTKDGLAIEIVNIEALHEILPKYFRHKKFASFQRQLNYFGFRKINKSKTIDKVETTQYTYAREYFTRDDRSLLYKITKFNSQKTSPTLFKGKRQDYYKNISSPNKLQLKVRRNFTPTISPISRRSNLREYSIDNNLNSNFIPNHNSKSKSQKSNIESNLLETKESVLEVTQVEDLNVKWIEDVKYLNEEKKSNISSETEHCQSLLTNIDDIDKWLCENQEFGDLFSEYYFFPELLEKIDVSTDP